MIIDAQQMLDDALIDSCIKKFPRKLLSTFIVDGGCQISEPISNLTDDECRMVCRKIINDVAIREIKITYE